MIAAAFALCAAGCLLAVFLLFPRSRSKEVARETETPIDFRLVEPKGRGFDLQKEKPIPYRPFRPGTYHLTMGIRNCPAEEYIQLDRLYKARMGERQAIIHKSVDHAIYLNAVAEEAAHELLDQVTTFPSARYPRLFEKPPDQAVNHVNGKSFSLPAEQPLLVLSYFLEEDVLVMMKEGDTYTLKAAITTFPAFDQLSKFNKTLLEIHSPVPGYEKRLSTSMERYFLRFRLAKSFRVRTGICRPMEM